MAYISRVSRAGIDFPDVIPPSEWPTSDQNPDTSLPGTDGYGIIHFQESSAPSPWNGTDFMLTEEEMADLGVELVEQTLFINYAAENNVEFFAQQGDGAWIHGFSGPAVDGFVTEDIHENFLTAYATLSITDTTLSEPVTVKEWFIESVYDDGAGDSTGNLKVNVNGQWQPVEGPGGTLFVKTPLGWRPAAGSLWVRTPNGWEMS